ncbi:protein PET117 homolog, mitochondrial [Corythoichthys intestinalis]|uniref:protein PET117 homolog, mitochondrial n=1 Tax=Corythoichthys intestinalis TaxID=161448 RepID=UPI0025A50972|nr:protein PET117 homolog, mitochondrial [Corythoichthys intestinalis]
MSRASKAFLALSAVGTVCTVAAVHFNQARERQRLHEGTLRDLERLERKKENARRQEEDWKSGFGPLEAERRPVDGVPR